jgi:RNA polymerase sigma factor (sigma-70 family)
MQRSAEERFREIYERHVTAVTAYVRRRAPADAVEDVVADTFLVCWRKLDRVPREALPWLYAVARNTLANERRAAARTAPASAERAAPAPEIAGDAVLAQAFAALPENDREVLRLVAWEQLALRDAARALGCSYPACRVRFHRARRRLAQELERLERGPAAASPSTPRTEGATQ